MSDIEPQVGPGHRPQALTPIYHTPEPNQSIQLYEGPVEVSKDGSREAGSGAISLAFLPSLRIKFDVWGLDVNSAFCNADIDDVSVSLVSLGLSVRAFASRSIRGGASLTISGHVKHPIFIRTVRQDLSYTIFHLINFHNYMGSPISETNTTSWAGRVVFEAEGWKVTIDAVRNVNHLIELLKGTGGYAITHVGKLERSDGGLFPMREGAKLLKALPHFFSFTRGLWCSPIFPTAFAASGDQVMKVWWAPNIGDWRSVWSWFPLYKPECLTDLFPGFLSRWNDPLWRDPTSLAIFWYLECNRHSMAVEAALIIAQAALELLSWVLLVEDSKVFSANGFNSLPAADKIREFLNRVGIPVAVPPTLTQLVNASAILGWLDGPQALTEIRNGLVHPKESKRKKVLGHAPEVRLEVMELACWYLELALLSLFNYKGSYINRLVPKRWVYEVESVPWTTP